MHLSHTALTPAPGRTGLGVPGSSKRPTAFPPTLLAAAEAARAAHPLPDVNQYLERNLGLFNERKAIGILRSVRKTLEELDRRAGMEDSVMWKAPEDKAREDGRERARRAFRGGDADPEDDFGVDVAAERKAEDRRGKGLEYDRGVSGVVVDQDSDDDEAKRDQEEEQEWLAFDVRPSQLFLHLSSLRADPNQSLSGACPTCAHARLPPHDVQVRPPLLPARCSSDHLLAHLVHPATASGAGASTTTRPTSPRHARAKTSRITEQSEHPSQSVQRRSPHLHPGLAPELFDVFVDWLTSPLIRVADQLASPRVGRGAPSSLSSPSPLHSESSGVPLPTCIHPESSHHTNMSVPSHS